jgi:hypothetical protein
VAVAGRMCSLLKVIAVDTSPGDAVRGVRLDRGGVEVTDAAAPSLAPSEILVASHPLSQNETKDVLAYGTYVISQIGRSVRPDSSWRHVHPLSFDENLDSLTAESRSSRSAVPIIAARTAISPLPPLIILSMVLTMARWRVLCLIGQCTD